MEELEIKALEINKTEILDRLSKLKAKRVFNGIVFSEFYKSNAINIPHLRLRSMKQKGKKELVELSLKKKMKSRMKNAKAREELAFYANSMQDARAFLSAIGFRKFFSVKKKRTSFICCNARIDIDEMKGIPAFLEIEGTASAIRSMCKKLCIKKYNSFSLSDLLKHYEKDYPAE